MSITIHPGDGGFLDRIHVRGALCGAGATPLWSPKVDPTDWNKKHYGFRFLLSLPLSLPQLTSLSSCSSRSAIPPLLPAGSITTTTTPSYSSPSSALPCPVTPTPVEDALLSPPTTDRFQASTAPLSSTVMAAKRISPVEPSARPRSRKLVAEPRVTRLCARAVRNPLPLVEELSALHNPKTKRHQISVVPFRYPCPSDHTHVHAVCKDAASGKVLKGKEKISTARPFFIDKARVIH